jgi:drug/metabolite transporter (DMT)-like permease
VTSSAYVRALGLAVVILNALGNYSLSRGMRVLGAVDLRIATNPWVLGGVVLLIGWLLAQLSLLSWADLTYVLPITAVSYVLSAILGAMSLHEHVTPARWSGILLIAGGVAVVSRTRARTAPEGDQQ